MQSQQDSRTQHLNNRQRALEQMVQITNDEKVALEREFQNAKKTLEVRATVSIQ